MVIISPMFQPAQAARAIVEADRQQALLLHEMGFSVRGLYASVSGIGGAPHSVTRAGSARTRWPEYRAVAIISNIASAMPSISSSSAGS
jgi:hypothetical protein